MDTNRSPWPPGERHLIGCERRPAKGVPSGKRETGSRPLDSNVILISAKNGLLIASRVRIHQYRCTVMRQIRGSCGKISKTLLLAGWVDDRAVILCQGFSHE